MKLKSDCSSWSNTPPYNYFALLFISFLAFWKVSKWLFNLICFFLVFHDTTVYNECQYSLRKLIVWKLWRKLKNGYWIILGILVQILAKITEFSFNQNNCFKLPKSKYFYVSKTSISFWYQRSISNFNFVDNFCAMDCFVLFFRNPNRFYPFIWIH